jgi:hypothetical protein
LEVHPVFALAVEAGSRDDKDTREETWAFFVRNFGNEGNCSELTHYWEGLEGKYYVQLPTPPHWADVSDVTVANSDAWLWNAGTAGGIFKVASPKGEGRVIVAKDAQAMYLEVSLPQAVESGPNQIGWGINGEVTLHYVLKTNRAHGDEGKREEPVNRAPAHAKSEKEVDWAKVQQRIPDAAVQQHVQQIFHTAFPGKDTQKHPGTRLLIDAKVHDHKPVLGAHHGGHTRPHRAKDPRMTKMNADLRQAMSKTEPAKGAPAPKSQTKP